MSDLPAGWIISQLEEVAQWGSGGTPSRTKPEYYGGKIPWIKTGELGQKYITDTEEKITELGLKNSSAKLFKKGSVAIAMYGATIGKTSILGIDATTNQACAVGFPIDGVVTSDYLYYYLCSQKESFINSGQGGAQPNISQGIIKSWAIPLAPLHEQKRIAEKLDALLARVDLCQTHLERVPQILKRFRQSVLAAATSGQLTEGWREEKGVNGEWKSVTLRDVATGFNYGTSAKSQKSGKIPVLRMGNIQDGKLDWHDLVFTSDKDEIEKYKLVKDDVLFNRTNSPEWVGKTAVYKGEQPAIYAGYLIRVKCGDELLPDFINYCLNSPMGRDWRWQVKSDGVSQSNINAQKLADFEFELPSLEEQTEIVRRVEKLFAYAERLEARYLSASERVGRLTPSLLAKAFRGELVGQDPNDEPASALVGRIRETRDAQKAGPSVKSKKSKRS
ncbi:MAG: Type-1 restriction enzyme EcoKI specificity protein [Anaerolineales bacterium]|nr:Type-1 restriction enzyme EcoKI specificity protein [Anaerolineales bacterium]